MRNVPSHCLGVKTQVYSTSTAVSYHDLGLQHEWYWSYCLRLRFAQRGRDNAIVLALAEILVTLEDIVRIQYLTSAQYPSVALDDVAL